MNIPSLLGDGQGNYRVHVVGNSGTGKFKERVSVAMTQNSKGWVIDGNGGHNGTLILDHTTDVIWLDPPLWFYLPRIFWRTLLRLFNIIPTCAEECNETWGEVLSTKGIIWYCISHHGYCKHRFGEMLARTSIAKGGNMRRLNEWDGDLTMWKAGLEEMLRAH
ncbi:hypothetical protein EV702DRAFT_1073220 [Suillus placidus]|uniref:Uncharacterized protein n=1 Tax=Suillus placidus TaxID=48579 RepID=A0A9P7D7U1_9AGAM|nr:hypothetical protein EV702DRAFT_1073220 [Suillus placidus]